MQPRRFTVEIYVPNDAERGEVLNAFGGLNLLREFTPWLFEVEPHMISPRERLRYFSLEINLLVIYKTLVTQQYLFERCKEAVNIVYPRVENFILVNIRGGPSTLSNPSREQIFCLADMEGNPYGFQE